VEVIDIEPGRKRIQLSMKGIQNKTAE